MAEIIEQRYETTLRYAADLRTALEGVVEAYNALWAFNQMMGYRGTLVSLGEPMQYAEEILKQMEVNEQIREISNE